MNAPTIFVIDDDAAVRDGLAMLMDSAGLAVETYDSAESFLAAVDPMRCGCVVLDMRMPGMNGLDLQKELRGRGVGCPIIFLTAHGDIPMTVRAMKAGASDFLTKPVQGADLLERIQAALARARDQREREAARQDARARLAGLTERERDVLHLAIAGRSNKEIARRLAISHRTVEVHRAHILMKTGTTTFLELAQVVAASEAADP